MRAKAAARLAEDVRQRGHLTTGFLGTPHLLQMLSRFGYGAEAYMLLNREEFPSWLYPVKQGATTIWERWDGIKPDGTFEDKSMNSFNHYAYGAVGQWLYGELAGITIDPAAPGYRHFWVQPRPGGGFTAVRAQHESPYGTLRSSWSTEDGQFVLEVTVPPNSSASVRLPNATAAAVLEGGHALSVGKGIAGYRQSGSDTDVDIGAGHYRFSSVVAP
jgi:alpha-L-rhamnosidase